MATNDLPPVSRTEADSAPPKEGLPPQIPGYQILECLGRGGMGVVWRARQDGPGREVALKHMQTQALGSETALARFRREVQVAARLEHTHVARVYEWGLEREPYFFSMEWIRGRHLDEYVSKEGLNNAEIMDLIRTVAVAMQYAHDNGVVHRDLKPSNILVTVDGAPHIVDFGVAKRFDDADDLRLTVSDAPCQPGTLDYMSPEQVTGKALDLRSDVYSLGVVAYRLLAGRFPYDFSGSDYERMRNIAEQAPISLRRMDAQLDADLDAMVLTTLAKDPRERYQTMADWAADIERWREGRPLRVKARRSFYAWKRRLLGDSYKVKVVVLLLVILSTFSFAAVKALHLGRRADTGFRNLVADHALAQNAARPVQVLVRLLDEFQENKRGWKKNLERAFAGSGGRKEHAASDFLCDSRLPIAKSGALLEKLGPDRAWFSHLIIGEDYLKLDESAAARDHFQKSLELFPDVRRLGRYPGGEFIDPNILYKERVIRRLLEFEETETEGRRPGTVMIEGSESP